MVARAASAARSSCQWSAVARAATAAAADDSAAGAAAGEGGLAGAGAGAVQPPAATDRAPGTQHSARQARQAASSRLTAGRRRRLVCMAIRAPGAAAPAWRACKQQGAAAWGPERRGQGVAARCGRDGGWGGARVHAGARAWWERAVPAGGTPGPWEGAREWEGGGRQAGGVLEGRMEMPRACGSRAVVTPRTALRPAAPAPRWRPALPTVLELCCSGSCPPPPSGQPPPQPLIYARWAQHWNMPAAPSPLPCCL